MKDETNKIVNWIEMGYTRLNYKEELSLVDYIKQLQQENKQLKEHIEKYEHYCKTTGIEELMKENKKYKEVIDKLKTNIENDIDGFRTINEFGESNEILELLDIYSDILKEVE